MKTILFLVLLVVIIIAACDTAHVRHRENMSSDRRGYPDE